jgi:hypothetical protein
MSMVFSLGFLMGIGFTLLFIILMLAGASVGSSGPH